MTDAETAGGSDDGQDAGGSTRSGPIGDWGERFLPDSHRQMLIEVEHLGRYAWAAPATAGKDVLDAGCGMGYGSALLLQLGARSAAAVDVDTDALAAARRYYGDRVEFHRGELAALPLPDQSYDVVTCFEVIEHVPDQPRALDELRRVLRPGGVLIISSPNRGVYPSGNPWHLHEYTPEELGAQLRGRFGNVRLYAQQPHFCSLITDLETAQGGEIAEPIEATVRKLEGSVHGGEPYTLGVASDGALPDLPNLSVAGGGLDVKMTYDAILAWEHRARRAEAERELELMDRQRAEMVRDQLQAQAWSRGPSLLRLAAARLRRRLRRR